jgi:mRNA interferase MazF
MDFDPGAGHEQRGRRPAVVLSPRSYNRPSGLGLFCPVTNRSKGYPFEVALPEAAPVAGVVLADHLRSLDWRSRKATFIGSLPEDFLMELAERLRPLLPLDDDE